MAKTGAAPVARTERLLVSEVDGESVVYDLDTNEAHLLNDTVAAVWRLCDGTRPVAAIADTLMTEDLETAYQIAQLALDELWAAGLMVSAPAPTENGFSRRDILIKLGVGAAALPVIISLAAAPASSASAGCPTACTSDSGCPTPQCGTRTKCCNKANLFNTCVSSNGGQGGACTF